MIFGSDRLAGGCCLRAEWLRRLAGGEERVAAEALCARRSILDAQCCIIVSNQNKNKKGIALGGSEDLGGLCLCAGDFFRVLLLELVSAALLRLEQGAERVEQAGDGDGSLAVIGDSECPTCQLCLGQRDSGIARADGRNNVRHERTHDVYCVHEGIGFRRLPQ